RSYWRKRNRTRRSCRKAWGISARTWRPSSVDDDRRDVRSSFLLAFIDTNWLVSTLIDLQREVIANKRLARPRRHSRRGHPTPSRRGATCHLSQGSEKGDARVPEDEPVRPDRDAARPVRAGRCQPRRGSQDAAQPQGPAEAHGRERQARSRAQEA